MQAAEAEHVEATGTPPPEAATDAPGNGAAEQFAALCDAGTALVAALRHLLHAWRNLVAAESQIMLASIPLLGAAAVAAVALAVSMWGCLVALVGWFLFRATGSPGIALGVLIVIHVLLVVGVWITARRSLRQAMFPLSRAELRIVGHGVQRALGRLSQTQAKPAGRTGSSPGKGGEA